MNRQLETVLEVSVPFVVGLVIGSFMTNTALKKVYAKRADEDIRSVKKHYMKLYKGGPYATPDKAVEAYSDRIDDLGYGSAATIEEGTKEAEELLTTGEEAEGGDEESDKTNTLATWEQVKSHSKYKPGFRPDYPAEVKAAEEKRRSEIMDDEEIDARDLTKPFVISNEEFMEDADENHMDKISLTYFSEDDTLIDEREDVIPNILGTIGLECLSKFGHKSGDPSIVMVRNLEMGIDFEVVLDERAYSEVVLGIRRPKDRPQKLREDD